MTRAQSSNSVNLIKDGYTLIEHAPLGRHNTLRVNAHARLLAQVNNIKALPKLLELPAVCSQQLLVLGQGSNVLFTDDFDGTVVILSTRGIYEDIKPEHSRITVAAGESWDYFVRWSLIRGFTGLENLIMIPGTVGAAPVQNIGAYGTELAEFVESVEVWDTYKQQIVSLNRTTCAFGYRDSLFKHQPGRYIVTAVHFLLTRNRAPRINYAGITAELERIGVKQPTTCQVAKAIIRLRRKKLPDPKVIGNAGSFFKNPQITTIHLASLKHTYPDLIAWPSSANYYKVSAAWLIEAAGYKGFRQGDAGISPQHALVLVNYGHASGLELWSLAQKIAMDVKAQFGVSIEPEPAIIGPH